MSQNPDTSQIHNIVVVIGKESVGKSQLISSLTGKYPASSNFRGTTISCDTYQGENLSYIDTPGLLMRSDSENVKMALKKLEENEIVLLVINAAHINEDFEDLIPLVRDKKGAVIITFWDKLMGYKDTDQYLNAFRKNNNIEIFAVDARHLDKEVINEVNNVLCHPITFSELKLPEKIDWQLQPEKNIFDIPVIGKLIALILLFVPTWLAVKYANKFADWLYPDLSDLIKPALGLVNQWHSPLNFIFGGTYGFVSMGPFLLLYALPTVIIFSFILALFKTTGLIDKLTVTLTPLLLPFGLTGRDLVRVIMGFGCKVPGVINTRSCSASSRKQTICAIGFGAACSYQLPATLSVFSMANMQYLGVIYLLILAITTMIYLRVLSSKEFRSANNMLLIGQRDLLQWPHLPSVWREIWGVLKSFSFHALPIFFVICIMAAIFEWMGLMQALSSPLSHIMKIFNLPGDVSFSVILSSIRKDGIMILGQSGILSQMSPVQVLTAVFLSGVLLPCIVTVITIAREIKTKFALKLIGIQALAAICFSIIIAWGGKLIFE